MRSWIRAMVHSVPSANPPARYMRLRLDYGTDGLDVDVPGERLTVIEPIFREPVADVHATLRHAIQHPIKSAPLATLVRRGQKIAISVCDITRAQPRRDTIEALFAEM